MDRKGYIVHVDGKLLGTLRLMGSQNINRLLYLKTADIELVDIGVGQILNIKTPQKKRWRRIWKEWLNRKNQKNI